ncbi:YcbK family protein [Cupriavidus sp. PET2-C1]
MSTPPSDPRRLFLRHTGGLVLAGALLPLPAQAAQAALASLPDARSLSFEHTHTGERIAVVYAVGDQFMPESLAALNRFLRDHYSGQVGVIDPQLFALLYRLRQTLCCAAPFQVISGYRSPATNARLRQTRGGGVASHSLHMDGKAIDIRLPGVALSDLRDAALSLHAGGVGFYPQEQFVHADTGRVRAW